MLKRYILYRLIIAVGILWGCSYTVSTAFAYEPGAQPDSWTYRQSYGKTSASPARSSATGYQVASGVPNAVGTSYRSSSAYGNAFNTTFSQDVGTDYNFRSTSSYTPMDNTPAYSAPKSGPRKVWDWSKPTDNPIGTVDSPVGEPLILLLMAGLYLALSVLLRRRMRKM